MKKIYLFVAFVGLALHLSSQTNAAQHLPVELKSTGLFNISAVRTVDTATFVDVHITFIPKWWSILYADNFIKNSDGEEKFYPKEIVGAVFNKKIWTPKSGDTLVTLVFDPLPKHVTKIDFGRGDQTSIFGIDLTGQGYEAYIKQQDVKALAWVQNKLSQAVNSKSLSSFDNKDFFKKDSVRIVGYIKGYDPRLGFSSGIIYSKNTVTDEDSPTTVRIYEDGTFEVAYEENHPIMSYMIVNRQYIPFYAEPGHTIGLLLDWEDFLQTDRYRDRSYTWQHIQYLGDLAEFNAQLFAVDLNTPDYRQLQNRRSKETPQDFKHSVLHDWKGESQRVDSILSAGNVGSKLSALIRAEVDVAYASYLFDYNSGRSDHSQQDTSNKILKMPLPDDYYDFINRLNLNSQTYLATSGFSTFINRFEFSPFYPRGLASGSKDNFAFMDSVAVERFSEIPFMVHLAKVRELEFRISYTRDMMQVDDIIERATKTVPLVFLKAEASRLKTEKLKREAGYDLPDTYGAEVFKNIIDKHQGKILIIDFWAEWCAPCRGGIEANFADREKHAGSEDFAFLFVTDGSTSDVFHADYAAKQKMHHAYKITNDEYMALRELFRFNGIPRYVLVAADGRILDDDFAMHNWKHEFERRFPDKFKIEML